MAAKIKPEHRPDLNTEDLEEMRKKARNEDPISGQPGAHPAAVGVGAAAGGAVAGAAAGAVAGPVGAAIGAVVGGVGGGLAGKAVGENIDPTAEIAYWRDSYPSRSYFSADRPFETYEPAYRYGVTHASTGTRRPFDEVEAEMRDAWDDPYLDWDEASPAVRDAYTRIHGRTR